MPIYEYVCSDCGLKFERLRSLSQSDEVISCPLGHNSARRKLSTFASFSRNTAGESTPLAGSGGCSSCSSSGCGTCGL
ncbi:zinc ribbon domain-containing protein [Chloroflexota bacterium]